MNLQASQAHPGQFESLPKILIVDDRSENLAALESILGGLEIQLVRANSGNEALAMTLEHDFALVLLDVQMPGMDGYETAELLRQSRQTHYLPVIFLSAVFSGRDYKIRGVAAGAVDFIEKPIIPEILCGKVQVFLELYQNRRNLQKLNEQLEAQVEERTAALIKEIEERKQAEEAAREVQEQARRAEQLEKELRSLVNLSSPPQTSVTARMYGVKTLLESSPEIFCKLVEDYAALMEFALEQQVYKVEHDISGGLRTMADILGFYKAGPRDVVDIHTAALEEKTRNASTLEKRQSYTGEGWIMALELMGNLASFYRNRAHGAVNSLNVTSQRANTRGEEK